jgi:hypothetical protein
MMCAVEQVLIFNKVSLTLAACSDTRLHHQKIVQFLPRDEGVRPHHFAMQQRLARRGGSELTKHHLDLQLRNHESRGNMEQTHICNPMCARAPFPPTSESPVPAPPPWSSSRCHGVCPQKMHARSGKLPRPLVRGRRSQRQPSCWFEAAKVARQLVFKFAAAAQRPVHRSSPGPASFSHPSSSSLGSS